MSILALFDAIEVRTETMIAEADRIFCEKIERDYITVIDELAFAEHAIKAVAEKYAARGDRELSEKDFSDCLYNPDKTLITILRRRADALTLYKDLIRQYFNSKYNLRLQEGEFEGCDDWRTIAGRFLSIAGGSLVEAGRQNVITDFREHIWQRNGVTLKKKAVSLGRYSRIISSYSVKLDRWDASFKALLAALSLFEKGETSIAPCIENSFPYRDEIQYGATIESNSECRKYAGLRVYKTGRVDLLFKTSEQAKEFFDLFNLQDL